jgi:hypothetical protein
MFAYLRGEPDRLLDPDAERPTLSWAVFMSSTRYSPDEAGHHWTGGQTRSENIPLARGGFDVLFLWQELDTNHQRQ